MHIDGAAFITRARGKNGDNGRTEKKARNEDGAGRKARPADKKSPTDRAAGKPRADGRTESLPPPFPLIAALPLVGGTRTPVAKKSGRLRAGAREGGSHDEQSTV